MDIISVVFSVVCYHVLNHTCGLHNAMADVLNENQLLLSDWDECLNQIAMSAPETEPGKVQLYHYLSFGWICGGIIEVKLHGIFKICVKLSQLSCVHNWISK